MVMLYLSEFKEQLRELLAHIQMPGCLTIKPTSTNYIFWPEEWMSQLEIRSGEFGAFRLPNVSNLLSTDLFWSLKGPPLHQLMNLTFCRVSRDVVELGRVSYANVVVIVAGTIQ